MMTAMRCCGCCGALATAALVVLALAVLAPSSGEAAEPMQQLLDLAAAARRANGGLKADIQAVMLPMRDGVKLWTAVVDLHKPGRFPSLMIRSPYGPDETENLADLFVPFGLISVMQNQRGTGQSEGNFTFWGEAANDEADTIAWIRNQSWSNGEVYMMGASADGINSLIALKEQQNTLAHWAIFATAQAYQVPFTNGALREQLAQHWLRGMQKYRPNAPSYFDVLLAHEGNSAWWEDRTLSDFANVRFPTIFWAGWYDIFLQPMYETFLGFEFMSNLPGAKYHKLVVGPRGHCFTDHPFLFPHDRMAEVWSFDSALLLYLNETQDHSQQFNRIASEYLGVSDVGAYTPARNLSTFTLYIMGPAPVWDPEEVNTKPEVWADRAGMYWTSVPLLPSFTPRRMYLTSNNGLSTSLPAVAASKSFIYNPNNPVPTVGGNNLFLACGPHDQRPIENRTDVVVFTSDVLEEDLYVVGKITATLYVSSNCTDTDFTVKLTDVYPEVRSGASVLISDSIIRMRWRESDLQPVKMVPGNVYEVTIEHWMTAYTFNKGHRMRYTISSSNSPRFSVNPNNGNFMKDGGPLITAINSVFVGGEQASYVDFPVVQPSSIPPNVTPIEE